MFDGFPDPDFAVPKRDEQPVRIAQRVKVLFMILEYLVDAVHNVDDGPRLHTSARNQIPFFLHRVCRHDTLIQIEDPRTSGSIVSNVAPCAWNGTLPDVG